MKEARYAAAMRTAERLALGMALALAACGAAGPALSPDAVILPETVADQLLHQCSRAVPPAYAGHWLPNADDIAGLEAALPPALNAARPADAEIRSAPQGWRRQYGGFLRGGRRFIYGNFFPRETGDNRPSDNDWHRAPVMICDGGPVFFGVEYDAEAGRFTQIAFQGGF
jgi:hypothetical protein